MLFLPPLFTQHAHHSIHTGPKRWKSAFVSSLFIASTVMGCDGDGVDSTALPGELGSNRFFYDCASLDDLQCRNELTAFPDLIAVGGSFRLVAGRTSRSSLFIRPASPQLVSATGNEFEFVRPGISAFLALDDGKIRDFVHLEAVPVDEIQVEGSRGERITAVNIEAGRYVMLTAVPLNDDDELAGWLPFRWTTDNETIVRVPRRGTEIRLEALQPGAAKVRVSLDGVGTTLNVTVTPRVLAPVEAGAGDAGVTTDAGPIDSLDAAIDDSLPTGDAGRDPAANDGGSTNDNAVSSDTETSSATLDDASTPNDAQVPTEAGDQ